jgi:hypothetical protein
MWPSMFIRLFTDFLEKEFSAENIMFWVACQEYKNNTGKKQIFNLLNAYLFTSVNNFIIQFCLMYKDSMGEKLTYYFVKSIK